MAAPKLVMVAQVLDMPVECPLAPLCDGVIIETTRHGDRLRNGVCSKCGTLAEVPKEEP